MSNSLTWLRGEEVSKLLMATNRICSKTCPDFRLDLFNVLLRGRKGLSPHCESVHVLLSQPMHIYLCGPRPVTPTAPRVCRSGPDPVLSGGLRDAGAVRGTAAGGAAAIGDCFRR